LRFDRIRIFEKNIQKFFLLQIINLILRVSSYKFAKHKKSNR